MEQQFNSSRQDEQAEAQVNIQSEAQAHAKPAFPESNATQPETQTSSQSASFQQSGTQTHANVPASQYQHVQPGKGKGTASLVLGILSIVDPFIVFGVPLGIVGIILAIMSKKEGHVSGVRTAGFVCSIVGLVLNAIILIWFIFAMVLAIGSMYYMDSFFDYLFLYM
jgi:hypothetical protein